MDIEIEVYAERQSNGGWELAESKIPNPWLQPEYRDLIDDREAASMPAEVPRKVAEFGHSGIWSVLWGTSRLPFEHVPIIPPRGLPGDLSVDLATGAPVDVEPFPNGIGWYMLPELLDHDWDQVEQSRRRGRRKLFFARRRWVEETHAEIVGEPFLSGLERLRAIDDPTRIRLVYWVGERL